MIEEGLRIRFVGEDGSLSKTLGSLQGQLKRFQEGLKNAGNVESFNRIQRAIDATKARIDALNRSASTSQGLKIMGTTAQRTTKDFTALSQLLQDLPFGLIGIQNNITRLVPAAGALGLGLSALVSAVTFAQTGFGAWMKGLFENEDAQKSNLKRIQEAKKALEEYVSTLSDSVRIRVVGAQEAQKELGELQTLYTASQNLNLSYSERKKAVDLLQERYPAYFKNLSDEAILAGNAKKQYDKLVNSILAAATARAAQKELDTLAEEARVLKQQREDLQKVEQQKGAAFLKRKEQNEKEIKLAKQIGETTIALENGIAQTAKEYLDAKNKSNEAIKKENANLERQKNISAEIQALIQKNGVVQTLGNPGELEKKPAKEPKLPKLERTPEIVPREGNIAASAKKIKDTFEKELQRRFRSQELKEINLEGLELSDDWLKGFENMINEFDFRALGEKIGKQISPEFGTVLGDLFAKEIEKRKDFNISAKGIEELKTSLEVTGKIGVQTFENIANATGDMFAALARGGDGMQAFLDSLKNSTAQLIGQLARAAILAAVLSAISGGTASPVTFGSAFSKILGLNKGGLVPGTGNRDTVPALLTPGEYVLTKDQTREFMPLLKGLEGISSLKMPSIDIGQFKGVSFSGPALSMATAMQRPNPVSNARATGGIDAVDVYVHGEIAGEKIVLIQKQAIKRNTRGY
jgi:hypothetical protein